MAVQHTSRSGMPRCVCWLANTDAQILTLPFSGLTAKTCQGPGSWCECCLAKWCVNWSTLKSWCVFLSRFICWNLLTLSWWSGRHLALIGQRGSMCTVDPRGGRVSLKLAELGPMLKLIIGGYFEELAGVHKLLAHSWQLNANWSVLLGFWRGRCYCKGKEAVEKMRLRSESNASWRVRASYGWGN